MNAKDAREGYYFATGKVSDIVRQLALGGIAVIWVLKNQGFSAGLIPSEFLLPCVFILISLTLDLTQYLVCSVYLDSFAGDLEKREGLEKNPSKKYYWTLDIIFYLKVLAMVIAYVLILWAVIDKYRHIRNVLPPETSRAHTTGN